MKLLILLVSLFMGVMPTATADETVVVHNDVVFKTGLGYVLTMDVYRPVGLDLAPALVAIHGGGWRTGSKAEWAQEARAFAEEGFVVFAVDYRLAPAHRAPAAVQDVQSAVEWVWLNGEGFGADSDRIGLIGSSAGGHLAMMAGTSPQNGRQLIDAVVSWSGPAELWSFTEQNAIATIRGWLGCDLSQCGDRWRQMSPITHVSKGDSPTLLVNSSDESIPVDQATKMHDALLSVGVSSEILVVDGDAHGYSLRSAAHDASLEFLKRELRN